MKKFIWEKIFRGEYNVTYRAKVPGGWLIRNDGVDDRGGSTESMVFVPEPEHRWQLEIM